MARDQSGSAHPSPEDEKASARAGRKRLGANGYPQPASSPDAQDGGDRATVPRTSEQGPAGIKGPAGAA
jgi:hypothetical protein